MDSTPTAFDPDAALGSRRAIIRRNPDDLQEVEMIEAAWGSNPQFSDGVGYQFVRSEGRTFPSHRCLVAASGRQFLLSRRHLGTCDGRLAGEL